MDLLLAEIHSVVAVSEAEKETSPAHIDDAYHGGTSEFLQHWGSKVSINWILCRPSYNFTDG